MTRLVRTYLAKHDQLHSNQVVAVATHCTEALPINVPRRPREAPCPAPWPSDKLAATFSLVPAAKFTRGFNNQPDDTRTKKTEENMPAL